MYSSSDTSRDSDEGVCFPPLILYVINLWVIFGVFVCKGLFWEYVMVVCELKELYCVWGGW